MTTKAETLVYMELGGGLLPGAFEEKYGFIGNANARRLLETAETFDSSGKDGAAQVMATCTALLVAYTRYCNAHGYDEAKTRELFELHMFLQRLPTQSSLAYTHVATMLKGEPLPDE
jgi:hypothetical protein